MKSIKETSETIVNNSRQRIILTVEIKSIAIRIGLLTTEQSKGKKKLYM